jgi:2'-5' RNA ligase
MTLRCFIGLPLPTSYQQGLERLISTWRERLRSRIAWTKPGNWHLTLFFLGDVTEEQLEGIKQRLAGVRSSRFQLQAAGGGFFPPGKAPRVIWVGLQQGGKQAGGLAREITEALQPLGYEPERRPFRAHLTVGRVKQDRRDDWNALLADMQKISWPAVQVQSFVLWKSLLRPEGPEYTRLAEYALPEGG